MFQDRLRSQLVPALQSAFKDLFGHDLDAKAIGFQQTRPEFEGDVTINVFPFLKLSGKGPEQTAQAIGEHLVAHVPVVERFNVVKGFLNIVIGDAYWLGFLREAGERDILSFPATGKKVMVEYASPNTNKPLHLGHLRNIFLGYSVSRILQAAGHEVIKAQVINDRGIHICKSMLAWQKFGHGETPQSSGLKGDKLVGKYYVRYDSWSREYTTQLAKEVVSVLEPLGQSDLAEHETVKRIVKDMPMWSYLVSLEALVPTEEVEKRLHSLEGDLSGDPSLWFIALQKKLKSVATDQNLVEEVHVCAEDAIRLIEDRLATMPIRLAQEMLRQWEANDPAVRTLWETMNGWVYEGFNATYARAGVDFDRNYYESQTYVLGKADVLEGLKKGVFYEKDGAVWVDNTAEGLDEKVLLRRDGTSVYMTQDIGTAIKRFEEYPGLSKLIYTVGNEQDYHFKVLFIILKKLGFAWADELFHLSYGMVDLPSGKMKSREGTVVDADDLIDEVVTEARRMGEELSKLDDFTEAEKAALYEMIGLAALKYFLLKVDPKKRMLFDPAASIDLQGHTGPFIQYTYARIKSLLRKAGGSDDQMIRRSDDRIEVGGLLPEERAVIKLLHHLPSVLDEAATKLDPSALANHTYELVKAYNTFYQGVPVLKEEDAAKRAFRLTLSAGVATATKKAMWCLGIAVPERM